MDALEFLARVASHIPDKGQVLQRYYGWYASRTRGIRRQAGTAEQPIVYAGPVPVPLRETRRRWAELLRRDFAASGPGWTRTTDLTLIRPQTGASQRWWALIFRDSSC